MRFTKGQLRKPQDREKVQNSEMFVYEGSDNVKMWLMENPYRTDELMVRFNPDKAWIVGGGLILNREAAAVLAHFLSRFSKTGTIKPRSPRKKRKKHVQRM